MAITSVLSLRHLAIASAAFVMAGGGSALAADAPADVAPLETPAPADHSHDIAFGVAFTTDYISRGASNTDNGPAVQPWAEFTMGHFYAGYWGSNVGSGGAGTSGWESDLSIGVRPTLGPVSIDLGYVHYIYSNSAFAANSGEAYIKGSINPVEPLTLGAAFYVNPANTSATYAELNGAIALPANFKVSGAVGTIGGGTFTPWNAGLSWSPVDSVTLDARYQAGGPTANKLVFTLSLATSASALKAMAAN